MSVHLGISHTFEYFVICSSQVKSLHTLLTNICIRLPSPLPIKQALDPPLAHTQRSRRVRSAVISRPNGRRYSHFPAEGKTVGFTVRRRRRVRFSPERVPRPSRFFVDGRRVVRIRRESDSTRVYHRSHRRWRNRRSHTVAKSIVRQSLLPSIDFIERPTRRRRSKRKTLFF